MTSAILFSLSWVVSRAAVAGQMSDRVTDTKIAQQHTIAAEESESSYGSVSLPKGTRLLRDIPYGDHGQQRFDVYLPRDARDAPVIFMVHGGAWRFGDKASAAVVQNKVARWVPRGFIFDPATTA